MSACSLHVAHMRTLIQTHVHMHFPFQSAMVQRLRVVAHEAIKARLSHMCALYTQYLPLTAELTQKLTYTEQEFHYGCGRRSIVLTNVAGLLFL